jgi:hypothetical protein
LAWQTGKKKYKEKSIRETSQFYIS